MSEGLTGGVGTTFYRAPEQEGRNTRNKRENTYGVEADIFSLGIILFEMFHRPFDTVRPPQLSGCEKVLHWSQFLLSSSTWKEPKL